MVDNGNVLVTFGAGGVGGAPDILLGFRHQIALLFVEEELRGAGLNDGGAGTVDAERITIGVRESGTCANLRAEGVLYNSDIERRFLFVESSE